MIQTKRGLVKQEVKAIFISEEVEAYSKKMSSSNILDHISFLNYKQ